VKLIRRATFAALLPLSLAAIGERAHGLGLATDALQTTVAQDSVRKVKATKPAARPAARKATSRPTPKAPAKGTSTAGSRGASPSSGGASATAPHASPSGAEHAAPTSAAATASSAAGAVKVNRFMSYDAASKTVSLDVIAALTSQQGGFNFNGGSNGSQTITVPQGWSVRMHVKNVDAIPHSAIVIADQHPLPNAPDTPAIPRAYSAHVNDGLAPQNGSDEVDFRVSKAGDFLIYCGVPGHGPSGMFIKLVVSPTAAAPSYSM